MDFGFIVRIFEKIQQHNINILYLLNRYSNTSQVLIMNNKIS